MKNYKEIIEKIKENNGEKAGLLKVVIQLLSLICFTESFSVSLYAVRQVVRVIVNGLGASLDGSISYVNLMAPILILLATIPMTIIWGRYYCGYICGFGSIQDWLYKIRRRFLNKSIEPSEKMDKYLSKIKYGVLLTIVIMTATGIDSNEKISPWWAFGRIFSAEGKELLADFCTLGGFLLIGIFVLSVVVYRPFCRFFCPMGALYSLISRFSWDKRNHKCENGGDCTICRYKCNRYNVNHFALIATIVVFVICNLAVAKMTSVVSDMTGASERTDSASAVEIENKTNDENNAISGDSAEGKIECGYIDGIYQGKARGYRGDITVEVLIENGSISDIRLIEYSDDDLYINSALTGVVPELLCKPTGEVDAVSGATYSSRGIIDAVSDALSRATEDMPVDDTGDNQVKVPLDIADGEYEGTADGFRGEIKVKVTVSDGEISDVGIVSYYDNDEYFFHAAPNVIENIVSKNSVEVDAVSGATYSSYGIIRAVGNALGLDTSLTKLPELKPKHGKQKRHLVQKFIESDEQYNQLINEYRDVEFDQNGKRISK